MSSFDYPDPNPPALLVPAELRADLIEAVVTALTAEVKGGSAEALERASTAAVEDIETHLDVDPTGLDNPVYDTVEDVPARVMSGLVTLAAASLKRPGFAYGVDGYDEADPLAVRARGAVFAALTPGLKERFGLA